ncbi:hypothetical protein NL524_30380, partial [Klebsiella pneumoniae]|nr:hypothetical protein [Klebsiella pneumoniae]
SFFLAVNNNGMGILEASLTVENVDANTVKKATNHPWQALNHVVFVGHILCPINGQLAIDHPGESFNFSA